MNDSLFDVKDRIVVVTGGLGQLGRQFSHSLISNGALVVILDQAVGKIKVDPDMAKAVDQENLLLVNTDVTNRESLQEALQQIIQKWGRAPFGLINNAALDSPPNTTDAETGPFESFPEKSWDRVMDVNVKGVFLACQVFGQAMAEADGGSIVNIGSTYGMVSPDHRIYDYTIDDGESKFYKPVAYSASKSALLNLTRYIAVYWGQSGVRANVIALGGVFNGQDERFLKGYCARVPIGRMANEDEYNGTVVYLMSDASSYVTGATILLDGGWTAW